MESTEKLVGLAFEKVFSTCSLFRRNIFQLSFIKVVKRMSQNGVFEFDLNVFRCLFREGIEKIFCCDIKEFVSVGVNLEQISHLALFYNNN